MSIAASHWHGDVTSDRFQRVYGTAFFNAADLDRYLDRLVALRESDRPYRQADLLLKRMDLRERRLEPLESRLQRAEHELRGSEEHLQTLEKLLDQHEARLQCLQVIASTVTVVVFERRGLQNASRR